MEDEQQLAQDAARAVIACLIEPTSRQCYFGIYMIVHGLATEERASSARDRPWPRALDPEAVGSIKWAGIAPSDDDWR